VAGIKTPQMCADFVMREIALGRMEIPGSIDWSAAELERLKYAVYEQVKDFGPKIYEQVKDFGPKGIDWARVVEHVGAAKTEEQCRGKVTDELRAGTMALPTASDRSHRTYHKRQRHPAPSAVPDPVPASSVEADEKAENPGASGLARCRHKRPTTMPTTRPSGGDAEPAAP
jgi:hypothetical protein